MYGNNFSKGYYHGILKIGQMALLLVIMNVYPSRRRISNEQKRDGRTNNQQLPAG